MFNFIIIACGVYGAIFFLDFIFKTCMFYPYLTALNIWGLTIKPFRVIWTITSLNRNIGQMGHFRFLRKWFDAGAFMCIFSIPAMIFLFHAISSTTNVDVSSNENSSPLVSVIPGVNTPASHLVYILPALLLSVIFHELGHALAASRENISIDSVGIALYVVIPIAFVNLIQEQLVQLPLKRQLRIYCAGIWHNLVLLIIFMVLMFVSPLLFVPIFVQGNGVTVLHIEQYSGAAQLGGFMKNDIITAANDCQIKEDRSWRDCLEKIVSTPQQGFCSSREFIEFGASRIVDANNSNCCSINSTKDLCFEETNEGIKRYACLPARKLIEDATFCETTKDCSNGFCLIPVLSSNTERFVNFQRKNKTSVLYIGSVQEIFGSVEVTQWSSRFQFISAGIVHDYNQFLSYVIGFNAGLILMNLVPCYGLDGGLIIATAINIYFAWIFKKPFTRTIVVEIFKLTGFLLIVNSCYFAIKNTGLFNAMRNF